MSRVGLLKIVKAHLITLTQDNFQRFCDKLFIKTLPSFQTVKAGGSNGDLSNDGYCHSNGTYFAAYAPEKYTKAKTTIKIDNDFKGVTDKWANVTRWVFLTKDKLTADVHKHIDKLRVANPKITIENWDDTKLIDLVLRLEDKEICELIEIEYPFSDLTNYEKDLGIISEIFTFVLENRTSEGEKRDKGIVNLEEKIDINFPDSEDKDYVQGLLLYAFSNMNLIEIKFSALDSMDQEDIHSDILFNYKRLLREKDSITEVMEGLFDKYTPSGKKDNPRYTNLSKSLVLFFFEDCTWGRKTKAERGVAS